MAGVEDHVISRLKKVPLELIDPDKDNYRRTYTKASLTTLGHSLAEKGQLQPALIEYQEDTERYTVVAGNRRYWSSRLAEERGWMKRRYLVAKVVRPLPPELRLRVQMAENDNKAPIPRQELAHTLWKRYKISLLEALPDLAEDKKDDIREAEHFWEIDKEYRKALNMTTYAADMGFSRDAVRRAFHYHTLHEDVKRQVEDPKNPWSYTAALPLARISNKDTQRAVLADLRRKEKTNSKAVKEKVTRLLWEEEQRKQTGDFLLAGEKETRRRTGRLEDLCKGIRTTTKHLEILYYAEELIEGLKDEHLSSEGEQTTARAIMERGYEAIRPLHEELMKDSKYQARWNHTPKRSRLEDFIAGTGGGQEGTTIMDVVEAKMIPFEKIEANDYNPRGEASSFDQKEIEELADSIEKEGLIQDILIMRRADGKYTNIEGHRRMEAMKLLHKKGRLTQVPAIIIPEIPEEEQIKIMCDSDLFEQVSKSARSAGMARQYELENRAAKGKLTVGAFTKNHPHWSSRVVRESIAYHSLPEGVKALQARGVISYGTAVELAKVKDTKAQRDLAISAGIRGATKNDIKKRITPPADDGQMMIGEITKEGIEEQIRQAELRELIEEVEQRVQGIGARTREILSNKELKGRLLQDSYLTGRFQHFVKSLERVDGEN